MLATTNSDIAAYFSSTNPKRLISPSGLELTEEQSQFVYWAMKWVYDSAFIERSELTTNTRFRLLTGLPGCGKSTCSMTLIAMLKLLKFKICLAAPTHQAKEVLIEMAIENNISVPCKTIYSLLGLRPEITEDGEEVFVKDRSTIATLGDYDFVILDEVSMLNLNLWTQIKYSHDCPLILCMGDIEQLRPVKSDKKSPVFSDIKEHFTLTKVVRFQGAIAQYVSAIRNSASYVSPANYANNVDIKVCNKLEWFNELANITTTGNSFRALAFKNKSVNAINKIVRTEYYKRKYGYSINVSELGQAFELEVNGSDLKATKKVFEWDELVIADYLAGDKLLFKKPFSEWSYLFNTNIVLIPNGTKAVVTRADQWVISGFDCYSLWVEWVELQENGYREIKQKQIYALAEHEKPNFSVKLDKLKQEALVYPKGRDRSAKFKEYFKLRNQFADVQHHFCSTIHKIQGGTYDYIFVFSDLLECRDLAVQKELNYVACSRAKTKLIICQ